MNKDLILHALNSAISLISDELNAIDSDELRKEFELTLEELYIAQNEIHI